MDLDIKALNLWQQQVFGASLLQRMLPNYKYFSQATQFGNYNLLQNQMDIIWQKLSLMPIKFSTEAQLNKLQDSIPNRLEFDIFAVYPAIDVCSGLVSLIESFDEKDTRCGQDLSLLSLNTVSFYIRLQLEQTDNDHDETSLKVMLEADPLFLWELETQQALYNRVMKLNPSKQSAQNMRQDVMQDGLTNLAIEY